PTPDSDVDLLIIMETSLPPVEHARQAMRLLRPRSFPVGMVVKAPDEVNEALRQGSPFLREILEKEVVVYERK
ncbi:MAG: nucleotidyltransferase domain-containing protein, partial [Anaerolineae bacterium]